MEIYLIAVMYLLSSWAVYMIITENGSSPSLDVVERWRNRGWILLGPVGLLGLAVWFYYKALRR